MNPIKSGHVSGFGPTYLELAQPNRWMGDAGMLEQRLVTAGGSKYSPSPGMHEDLPIPQTNQMVNRQNLVGAYVSAS